jgi:glycine dehydrogenase subunit 1
MRYLPHTDEEIASMLGVVGADSLDDLFSTIPDDCRRPRDLDIPDALTEWELNGLMETLSSSVAISPEYRLFLGAGRYDHFIPASLTHLLGRSEFVTPYTPYQPEMSQGTLQAIYEYQTLAARLLGMEVSNASLYDGASALAEALLMAIRITRRKKVAVSNLIHPYYRRVVQTYFEPTDLEMMELPYLENGRTDLSRLDGLDGLAAVAVQSPNFFGCLEDLAAVGAKSREKDLIFITSFTEPLAYGLFKNPGSQGAHIACGEGQSLGIPKWFG